jgi:hypothetical protein
LIEKSAKAVEILTELKRELTGVLAVTVSSDKSPARSPPAHHSKRETSTSLDAATPTATATPPPGSPT